MDNDVAMKRTVALAGNPNVGKSTIFNGLTGLKQHTGNWSGKTVGYANGTCQYAGHTYNIVDIPGAYSLLAHSGEEEVARDYLCFGGVDGVIVVCDGTCLERNLNLLLQILEFNQRVVVCVNLLDEAAKKGIKIDLALLEEKLGVPVVGTVAHHKTDLDKILQRLEETLSKENTAQKVAKVIYPDYIEEEIGRIAEFLPPQIDDEAYQRWLALRFLENDAGFKQSFLAHGLDLDKAEKRAEQCRQCLQEQGIDQGMLADEIVTAILKTAQSIAEEVICYEKKDCYRKDRQIDRILTGKISGYLCMALLLIAIFWLTIVGANYPSQLLGAFFNHSEIYLADLFARLNVPTIASAVLLEGVWRTVGWVVAVMLPPMAIFFPLFTLLEDVGYLPRIAYNLDKPFKCCKACGKQALTMCMGLGCNAVGVMGCRIIDSPRERLLAILTNSLMPCNGRLSALIMLFSLLMLARGGSELKGIGVAIGMSALLVLSLFCTLMINRLLSQTILKGVPSSFVLELPSYRKPQIAQVLVRSVFERTLLVLKRAVVVAAPVGALLWILANVAVGEMSLLSYLAAKLDGIGSLMGLDGVILLAFILGLPANEIVVPIIIMGYLAEKGLVEIADVSQLQTLFWANGWSEVTVICLLVFMLFHWPCATTIWTIRKESASWKWSLVAILIPTLLGMGLCIMINMLAKIFIF